VTRVEIDIDKLGAAMSAAEGLATRIDSNRRTATGATPIELTSLSDGTLGKVSRWLTDSLPELQTRHDLAVLLDRDETGHASYDVYDDNLSAVKRLLGEELGDRAEGLNIADPDSYNAYAELLGRWADDAEVMNSMYMRLGPEGTLAALSSAAASTRNYDPAVDMEDQQRMLDLLRDGLESATTYPAFPDQTFAEQLVEQATRDPNDIYRDGDHIGYNPSGALAFLLTDGHFDSEFTSAVADELDDYERVQMDGAPNLWGQRPDNGADFSQFAGWGSPYDNLDPMTGLMSALENDPRTSLEFFSDNDDPDQPGEGINSRAYYYLHERSWDQDQYDAITGAIDSATTDPDLVGDPTSADAQDAARLVSKFVDYVSTRDNIDDISERINWPGNDASANIAHMLTTYMGGVDYALTPGSSSDVDPGVFTLTSDADRGEIPNMPLFDRDSLSKISLLALTSDDGFAQMREGLNEYRADKLGSIADQLAANPDAGTLQNGMTQALGADARMEGFFVRALQDDHIATADAADARTKGWIDFGSDVVDLLPVPGVDTIAEGATKEIVNAAIDRGKGAGQDAITDWLVHEGKDARASADDAAQSTLSQQSFVVASLLADRGLSGTSDIDVPTWDEYQQMNDAEQATTRSRLFSEVEGVGGYFNIDDYNQAYRDEFQDYFR
jgi:hypothetical protein